MESTTFLILVNWSDDLNEEQLKEIITDTKENNFDSCICLVSDSLEMVELAEHLGILGILEHSKSPFLAIKTAIRVLGIREDDTVVNHFLGIEKCVVG